jgi:SAM-dependent methyltransferase
MERTFDKKVKNDFIKYNQEWNDELKKYIYFIPDNDYTVEIRKKNKNKKSEKRRPLKEIINDPKSNSSLQYIIQSVYHSKVGISSQFYNLFKELVNKGLSEEKIYETLKEFHKNVEGTKEDQEKQEVKKAIVKAQSVYNILKSVVKNMKISSYLDIGCFTGLATFELGKMLGLTKKEEICGVDIIDYSSSKAKNFTFALLKNENIPFDNETFDVITALMTLHHVKAGFLNKIVAEINRVCKIGGIFFLKEHDVERNDTNLINLLNLQHLLYDSVFSDKTWNITEYSETSKLTNESRVMDDEKIKQEEINYLTTSDWTNLFVANGFSVLKPALPITESNPLHKINIIFKKVKNV